MISSSSRRGSRPLARRASSTATSPSGWRSWAGETLTATASGQPFRPPGLRLAAGLAQDPGTQRMDEAARLRHRHELAGQHQAALRVVPAHQRLDRGEAAALEVELRLVVQHELAALERPAQLAARPAGGGAPRRPSPGRTAGSGGGPPASPGRARGRRCGAAPPGPCPSPGKRAMPEARRGVHLLAVEVEGQGQARPGPCAPGPPPPPAPAASAWTRANSSPPVRASVSLARIRPPTRWATARKQPVAGIVAEAVVDVLEPVEVEAPSPRHRPARGARVASAWPSRSRSSVRLGRPVSASCRARCSIRASAALRAVMSTAAPITCVTRPCRVAGEGGVAAEQPAPAPVRVPHPVLELERLPAAPGPQAGRRSRAGGCGRPGARAAPACPGRVPRARPGAKPRTASTSRLP